MGQCEPLVSIVMPVYNSEEYLAGAVRSILGQSYRNLELILVDDGSKDASGRLCDEAAAEDPRVVVIHKENGGICSARNAGLDAARGTYVMFSDNDDECLPGFVEDNVRIAEETGKDVVRFLREHRITVDGEVLRSEVLCPSKERYETTDATMRERYYKLVGYGSGVWSALYRRSVLERGRVRFPEAMRFGYEDVCFNLLVLEKTAEVVVNPNVYYVWSERYEHSTSRKFSTNRLDSLRMCLQTEQRVGDRYGLPEADAGRWLAYLIDTYAIRVLGQLSLPMCDLSSAQKAEQLRLLCEEEAFTKAFEGYSGLATCAGPKTRIVAALLKRKRFGLLIRLFTWNARLQKRVY